MGTPGDAQAGIGAALLAIVAVLRRRRLLTAMDAHPHRQRRVAAPAGSAGTPAEG